MASNVGRLLSALQSCDVQPCNSEDACDEGSEEKKDKVQEKVQVKKEPTMKFEDWKSGPLMLQGRYKISHEQMMGQGSFAHVYKGLDMIECHNVAVKVYRKEVNKAADNINFLKTVEVLQTVGSVAERTKPNDSWDRQTSYAMINSHFENGLMRHSSYNEGELIKGFRQMLEDAYEGDASDFAKEAKQIVRMLDFSSCFVRLLDFSKDALGMPGRDEETDALYLVLEMGEETLEERLRNCIDMGKEFEKEELRRLQWQMILIVCGLHGAGYVHLDIKPANIMYFRGTNPGDKGTWKLIDLDGAMPSGARVEMEDCATTAIYMPPEFAKALSAEGPREGPRKVTLSRLMDVWSIGLTALEAVFRVPVLAPWYDEWEEETGDEVKFVKWLADFTTEAVLSGDLLDAMRSIDPDMSDLLAKMIQKDPAQRVPISECVMHKWFQPIRTELMQDIIDDADEDAVCSPKSRQCVKDGVTPIDRVEVAEKVSTKVCTVM